MQRPPAAAYYGLPGISGTSIREFAAAKRGNLRSAAQHHLSGIGVNPLDAAVDQEIAAANTSYRLLMQAAVSPNRIGRTLDKDRRQQLAAFGATKKRLFTAEVLHYSSFGMYTRRVPETSRTIELTRSMRRVEDLITFLTHITRKGTRPEVSFDTASIESTVDDLSALTRTSPAPLRRSFIALTHKLL